MFLLLLIHLHCHLIFVLILKALLLGLDVFKSRWVIHIILLCHWVVHLGWVKWWRNLWIDKVHWLWLGRIIIIHIKLLLISSIFTIEIITCIDSWKIPLGSISHECKMLRLSILKFGLIFFSFYSFISTHFIRRKIINWIDYIHIDVHV